MASPNPNTWTDLRRAHFEYFKNNLDRGDKTKKLVDLGAGQVPFREMFFQYDYYGIDFQKFESDPKLSERVRVGDLTKPLDIPNDFCHVVTLLDVLEHIPNPQDLLKECFRILKRGGFVIGAVPFLVRLHQEPYDFHRYTNYALDYLLKNAGFFKIEVENVGSPFYVYKETQDYFFNILLRSKPKGLTKYLWILYTKFTLWQTRVAGRSMNKTIFDNSFPAGYGFKAIKRN